MQWLFFELDAPAVPFGPAYKEMQPISPALALAAIEHTRNYGGYIELYLDDTDDPHIENGDTPFVGLCFQNGRYAGYGLGSPRTAELEAAMQPLRGGAMSQPMPEGDTIRERVAGLLDRWVS
jgi:hypothetical protein